MAYLMLNRYDSIGQQSSLYLPYYVDIQNAQRLDPEWLINFTTHLKIVSLHLLKDINLTFFQFWDSGMCQMRGR